MEGHPERRAALPFAALHFGRDWPMASIRGSATIPSLLEQSGHQPGRRDPLHLSRLTPFRHGDRAAGLPAAIEAALAATSRRADARNSRPGCATIS